MNSSDVACAGIRPARFLSGHVVGPLAALCVDPDPELQVRHRRTRGRAMVCENLASGQRDDGIAAAKALHAPERITPTAALDIVLQDLRQNHAEPTKMQRPLNARSL
jgi:hypothetical protein